MIRRSSEGRHDSPPTQNRALRTLLLLVCFGLIGSLANAVFDETVYGLWLVGPLTVTAHGLTRSFGTVVALFASALTAIGVVVATVGSTVPTDGVSRLLTTEWPSPTDPAIIATVMAGVSLGAYVAAELTAHQRWNLLPLLPVAVTAATAAAFGAPAGPAWAPVTALGAAAALFALVRPGERPGDRLRAAAGPVGLPFMGLTAVGVVAALMLSITWTPDERADPRHLPQPDASVAFVDPVEAVVALQNADPPLDLYSIRDVTPLASSGLPTAWRVAALNNYDGQRWLPQTAVRPIGGRLSSTDEPNARRFELTVGDDRSELAQLVPFPGTPRAVTANVETDLDRTLVRLADPPQTDDQYTIESDPAPPPSASPGTPISQREPGPFSSSFREVADALAGTGTPSEQLLRLEATMRDDWQLDPDGSGSGLQQRLIESFIVDQRRGTEPQFVTAFTLLARSLGYDARVAIGFLVDQPADRIDITSAEAAIWPEVRFGESGWVRFDPVPPEAVDDSDEEPPAPQAQAPAAEQPPIAPPSEQDSDDDNDDDSDDAAGAAWWSTLRAWAGRVMLYGAVSVGPIAAVLLAIIGYKWWRRRRRERSEHPTDRVRGVWANTTDLLVDAGVSIPPSWTNAHIASSADELFGGDVDAPRSLAAMATGATFGSPDFADRTLATDALDRYRTIDTAIAASLGRWRRWRWRLSLRSIRPRTRSPVR